MKIKKCTISRHRSLFDSEEKCLQYLCSIKWKEGYRCRKCRHDVYVKGRIHFDRRCQKCGYNESPTSGTLFHSTKLQLVLYFEIIYRIAVNKKGLSAVSIAREYGVNQKTADRMHFKIQKAMTPLSSEILHGEIHIDEFFFGGKEENKQGRCAESEKLRATLAVEILPSNKIGKVHALHIQNFSSKELVKILKKHCTPEALIITDKWSGYKPLIQDYPNLYQIKSNNGESFPQLHLVILLIKKFFKGIHHNISLQRFQSYLNEFTFRFNKRNFIESINLNLINQMAKHPKFITYKPPNLSKIAA